MYESPTHEETIYCHGLPGSAREIFFLAQTDRKPSLVLGPQEVDDFIGSVSTASCRRLHVVGFSLGAMAAVKIAESNSESVSQLSLISPAAPLELGHFTDKMAGRFVFKTAIRSAFQLRILTALQLIGTTMSSNSVIKAMFKNSPDSEIGLLSEPAFIDSLLYGLSESYGRNGYAYRRAIIEYVQPWGHRIENITSPVRIYHGSADNWAPITMAYALQQKFHSDVEVIEYENLGHFSTLRKALPYAINGKPDKQRSTLNSEST